MTETILSGETARRLRAKASASNLALIRPLPDYAEELERRAASHKVVGPEAPGDPRAVEVDAGK